MTGRPTNVLRFCKYNLVGLMGLAVKFSVLIGLVEAAGCSYLLATALAVEAVVLHNFVWHHRWTWHDRSTGLSGRDIAARALRFHVSTGIVAITANLLIMRLLVGGFGIHYFAANLAATGFAGLVNFMLSEFLVFVAPERTASFRT